MTQQLNPNALGVAGSLVSALVMFLLGVGGNVGVYEGAALQMQKWHMFFSFSLGGIIAGMIEAAIISYIFLFLLGRLYNWQLKKEQ